MSAFAHIIGHARAVHRLRTMLANGTLPHALLFHGPRGVGARTLAEAVAEALLGGPPAAHVDFLLVERERDAKTGKLKKQIPVDAIRALRDRMRLSPFHGGRKIALIDGAEALSDAGANALLKTLEEPSGRTTLLLCAREPHGLPPTILSRVAGIPLTRVPEAELELGLVRRGAGEAEARRIAARSDGRPGLAVGFLEKSGVVDWYAQELKRWDALRAAPLHRRFALVAELTPPRADREETADRIRETFAFWEARLRRELRGGSLRAAAALRRLASARAALATNAAPRALLETFVMTLD